MDNTWTDEHIFFDGDAYFDDVIQAIESARESVDLETYIYSFDPVGIRFEAALVAAAKRGVYVRLLVDGIGASGWFEKRSLELMNAGARVRVYHPVRLTKIFIKVMSDLGMKRKSVSRGRDLFSRLNRRDHRKVCIVDYTTAWVGSLNVSADHSVAHRGANAWRDTAVRVRGLAVQDLIAAFDHAWLRSHTPDGRRRWSESLLGKRALRLRPRSPLVRLNFSRRLRLKSFHEFRRRIQQAKTRIWITNAYLAPSKPIIRSLSAAAERGVDVRVLTPRKSDVFFMPWVATAHYVPLLKGGVRIFEYLPRFLHAKSAMIDDWAIVGTSNMNRRSLLNDLEVDIVLTKEESLRALETQFAQDLEKSQEVKAARGGPFAWLGRMITLLLKNWI